MAGIGFTLRRMLAEEGLFGPLKAFGAALGLASGPWVSASLALSCLGAMSALGVGTPEARIFLALVSHAFAFSLVTTGTVQMAASRFLADRLYTGRHEDVAPAFWQLLVPLWALEALGAGLFLAFVPIAPAAKAVAIVLVLALGGIWVSMSFLSAARRFGRQLAAFALGSAAALALGLVGAQWGGLTGQLIGFTAAQALTCLVLLREVERTFGPPRLARVGLGRHLLRHGALVGVGTAYNVGLWLDKWLFWQHPVAGEAVAGVLRASPVYDEAMFMAYMTVLPALGLFLLRVETDFNDQVRAYFATIEAQRDLAAIEAAKARMAASIRAGLGRVVQLQGALTVAILLAAPQLAATLGLSWFSVAVFRAGVLGAFFHALHLMVLVMLLYLDFRRAALVVAGVFVVTNGVATTLAFAGGLGAYGFGAAIAHLVTLAVALAFLEGGLRRLEFFVFFRQAAPRRPWRRREARS